MGREIIWNLLFLNLLGRIEKQYIVSTETYEIADISFLDHVQPGIKN